MPINVLKQIWPEWSIGKRIGGGAYGTVYEASRNEYGVDNHAAIKIISIPASEAEIDTLRSEGFDMRATKTHFQMIVHDFVDEIKSMVSLEGHSNIVNIKNYKVVEKKKELGWHIFILMELLTPLAVHTCDHKMSETEVIKLGCDICTALETCAEKNIIHRDIKPGNILVHNSGAFKLGDFGVSRKLERMTGGLSQNCGTPDYMAPEVASGTKYDNRCDIYSLGMVLYRYLNKNRPPFISTEKQLLNPNERWDAIDRRIRGEEELPAPCEASPAMADLILRACAHDPNMRFSSAAEMKQALLRVANGTYQVGETIRVRPPAKKNEKPSKKVNTFTPKRKYRIKWGKLIVTFLLLLLSVAAVIFAITHIKSDNNKITEIIDEAEVLAGLNDYEGAVSKLEVGIEEYPKSEDLQEKYDEYTATLEDQKIDAIVKDADTVASNGGYEEAIETVKTGLIEYPENALLQSRLSDYEAAIAEQVKKQTLSEAQALADIGEYESAMSIIKAAQEAYGEDKEYDTAYKSYHKAYSLEDAAILADSGDYAGAITLISNAQKINENDVDLISAYNAYCDSFIQIILVDADALTAEWKIDEAIGVVKSGLKTIPDSPQLNEKLERLNDSKPVSITSLTSINASKWYWNEDDPIDPFGNSYASGCNYVVFHNQSSSERSVEYRTYGEYSTLTGVIAPHADIGQKITCTVLVYADDQLVYTSPAIVQKTDAFTFSADVSGAEYVKIEVRFNDTNPFDVFVDRLIISDVKLWPQQKG